MNDRINGVKAGTGIRASWGNEVVDQIKRLQLIPGNGIKISTSSKGTRIELDLPQESVSNAEGGISDVIPCIVTGGTAEQGYSATLYANGLGERSTGNGTLWCPELATQSDIPEDSSILAHVCLVTFTQSDEEGEEVGPEPEGGNS